MAAVVIVALLLACLGAGRAALGSGGVSARLSADGVAGLTGLALLTGLAGWLVLAGAYSQTAGWVLLTLGGIALVADLVRARAGTADPQWLPTGVPVGAVTIGLLSLGLALGRALGELSLPFVERNDDLPTYWYFPRLLLESGGFIQPFSWGRIATLGATPFVQSFFWKDFGIAAAGMTDAILGQLLIWAGVRAIPNALSTRPQPAWLGEALALAALLLSLALPRWNSMPTLLPMGGTIVIILLTQRMSACDTPGTGIRTALAWGLVAAWLIGLRISIAPFPALLWLVSAVMAVRNQDRQLGLRLTIAALATLMGLLPWSLTLWQSSGTPLFPIFAGNYHFERSLAAPLDFNGLIAFVGDCLWTNHVWIIAAIGGLAALRPGGRLLALQVTTALVALVLVTAIFGRSLDSFTIYRYSTPLILAGLVFLAGSILVAGMDGSSTQRVPRWPLQSLLLGLGVALWLVMPLQLRANSFPLLASNGLMVKLSLARVVPAVKDAWNSGLKVQEWPGRSAYVEAQALLPPDARLVSATETPFFFRFDHQVIHTMDIPGLVAPPPGIPSFEGPEALVAYLRGLGYTHLAFTPPGTGTGLYSRAQWLDIDEHGSLLVRNWARFVLMYMQNEERLAQTFTVLYQNPALTVIDLRRPMSTEELRR
jgi:hypothetical protein